ncbi:hypothetical protein [Chryseobacterium sp. CFBP8996]|uniref:hypothetical protein n=1 Tax=Chryseobacterium sp. CFBP8996 TaxID=3096529 RepID=UPI002A6B0DB4|nr:hypothetical protein [Chryseobacterium sp. CFBP8996]MDY0931123.1 hypothetical protein [Chryseobacterium sp. CFBP8996]
MFRSLGIFLDFEIQLFNQNIEIKTIENLYNTFLENKVPNHANGHLAESTLCCSGTFSPKFATLCMSEVIIHAKYLNVLSSSFLGFTIHQ